MHLGIMQPYFFPNLAHFALIAATDAWVVFDVTQYTKKSWISRNRILHPTQGWQYISVPVQKSSLALKIYEVRVADPGAFHQSIRGKLSHYKKTAPQYDEVCALVDRCFADLPDDRLVTLNVSTLRNVCAYLEIPFDPRVCSTLDLEYPDQMGPGDWAPFVAGKLGAQSYVNPLGGRELFDPTQFTQQGIKLCFSCFGEFDYATPGYAYSPGLSILDVLMWNTPQIVRDAALDLNEIVT